MSQSWSSEVIVHTICKMNADGEKLNSNYIQLNHRTLYVSACRYFGSWKAAIEAAGLNYNSFRLVREKRTWNQTEIIRAILARNHKGLSLGGESVSKSDRGLYQAAKRYFGKGGWKKALRIAGFDPLDVSPKRMWKRDRVLTTIRKRFREDKPLYGYYLVKNGYTGLYTAGKKLFGSWEKAVEAAGIEYSQVRAGRYQWWSRERVVSEIQRLESLGSDLSSNFTHRFHGDLFAAAIVYCNSWAEAVTIAGFDYQQYCKVWSSKAWLHTKKSTSDSDFLYQVSKFTNARRKN